MKIEESLRSNAYDVATFAVATFRELEDDSGRYGCRITNENPGRHTTTILIQFLHFSTAGGVHSPADFTIYNTLPGRCHLIFNCRDKHWPALRPRWERLVDELRQQGWIEGAIDPPVHALESEPTSQRRYDKTGGAMKFQERLNVSPYVFYGFAQIFWSALEQQGYPCFFMEHAYHWASNGIKIVPGITPIVSELSINKKHVLQITAVETLPGKSILTLECADEHWSELQPWWERFKAELVREGLIDQAIDPPVIVKQSKANPRRRLQGQTPTKIRKIAQWRQREINNYGKAPFRTGRNGIQAEHKCDPTLVRTHAPELWENWNDTGYVWVDNLPIDEEDS